MIPWPATKLTIEELCVTPRIVPAGVWSLVCDRLGVPARIALALRDGNIASTPILAPQKVADANRIVHWDRFGREEQLDAGMVVQCSPSSDGCCLWRNVRLEPLAKLVQLTVLPSWSCDIRKVEALGASKSPLYDFEDLDALALARCPQLVRDISESGLGRNLAHDEIRILRSTSKVDFFQWYQWDGRVFLANSGGSHHFSAARFIAGRIGRHVQLEGALHMHSFSPEAVAALGLTYDIFSVRSEDVHQLQNLMRALKATFLFCPAPPPYANARIVFLPKDDRRSSRVARVLYEADFFDLGRELHELSQRPQWPPL